MKKQYNVTVAVHPEATTSLALFTALVTPLIQHPLGWVKQGYKFYLGANAAPHRATITITLAPQHVMDAKFPDFAHQRLSVCNMVTRHIYLNEARWCGKYTDNASKLQLPAYRAYMVQHELGHALGLQHARPGKAGEPAPIMVQQTLGIGECIPYPFPS